MPTKSNNSKLVIDVQCATTALETNLDQTASSALIRKWARTATQCGGLLTLRFVNAVEGKKLNLAFRTKDYATNVLTFPSE
jgi:probable rRNA maturation factor